GLRASSGTSATVLYDFPPAGPLVPGAILTAQNTPNGTPPSVPLQWTSVLPIANGGTNNNVQGPQGAIAYSDLANSKIEYSPSNGNPSPTSGYIVYYDGAPNNKPNWTGTLPSVVSVSPNNLSSA